MRVKGGLTEGVNGTWAYGLNEGGSAAPVGYGKIGAEPYFPTLGRAVDAYQEEHREGDWANWEDSEPGLTW